MAVFRVEKNKGYTVMSNHHLRNKELSLKAKGLLSQMLSLPEDWDYTLAGLSLINRESIDAIRTAVWELAKKVFPYYLQCRKGLFCQRIAKEKRRNPATLQELYVDENEGTLFPRPVIVGFLYALCSSRHNF